MGKREKLLTIGDLKGLNCKEDFNILEINNNIKTLGIIGSKNGGVTNCTEVFINRLVTEYAVDTYALAIVDCDEEIGEVCECNRIKSMEHVIKNCSYNDLAKVINSIRAGLKENTHKKKIILIHDLSILMDKCSQGHEANLIKVMTDFIGEIKTYPNTLVVLATNDFFNPNIKELMDEIIVFKSAISLSNRYMNSTKASSIKAGMCYRVKNNIVSGEKEKIPLIEKSTFKANLEMVRKSI